MTDADVITRLLHAIDALDWAGVRDCFTDPLRLDYTSLWGGEPETLTPDELVARWTGVANEFGATQHLTGPVLVVGDRLETHVRAHHWRTEAQGGQAWTVYGHYVARLADGKIAELVLRTYRAEGDPALPSIVSQRPQ
jgi:hypothetical protein